VNIFSSLIEIKLTRNHANRDWRRIHGDGVPVEFGGRQTEQTIASSHIEKQHPAMAVRDKGLKFGTLLRIVNLILHSELINARMQSKGESWRELQLPGHAE
jgi:hypothetical protein